MIPFPVNREEYNRYVYQYNNQLVYIISILSDSLDQEFICLVNQNKEVKTISIADFNVNNFIPLIEAADLSSLVEDIQNIRGLGIFARTFQPPTVPE
ncbi:hypothetical protein [Crocosphaera sp.]|uniref:hypothetical protein n=1 Tax=Crocosphaera sp. TaxID=2729996 RepID=UPI00262F74A0|nr:hypothetical protein [Crocosphaera sp.]MDJ0579105.1 hypothetical protein [Crocosphaera sp.]